MGTEQLKHAQIHIKDYGTVYTDNKIDHLLVQNITCVLSGTLPVLCLYTGYQALLSGTLTTGLSGCESI